MKATLIKQHPFAKYLLVGLLGCFFGFGLSAQEGSIRGTITDAATNERLTGAHLVLTELPSGTVRTEISSVLGGFFFSEVGSGRYRLSISYIGYRDTTLQIVIGQEEVNLGTIGLREGVDLSTVEVQEQVLPAQQKGDTLELDARAYKTLPDADAGELLEKMPTVTMEEGRVQAQGEDVQRVLVDGRPFFGNDPTAALRNLPAEVVDKIQIFDEQSEQAQFTGFDDGQAVKTINIVTRTDMRNGQFGKVYGGYGTDDRYQAGGNLNFFDGDQRLSLIGMANNINQQNFATEDLLGVVGTQGNRRGGRGGGRGGGRFGGRNQGASTSDFLVAQQNGISTTSAAGINFSDKWGETDVSASYFFNRSENISEQLLDRQFTDSDEINELYRETSDGQSDNTNHRFNARVNFQLDRRNSLLWRPTVTWQGNDGSEQLFAQSLVGTRLLNQTESNYSADLQALSLSNSLLWRHRFATLRRTFSVNLTTGYAPKSGDRQQLANSIFGANRPDTSQLDQIGTLDIGSWNARLNLQYTEPIGRTSMLLLNYQASYQQEESTVETFDFVEATGAYDDFNEDLSNIFSNDYYTQQLGGGVIMRKGQAVFIARANVQWAQLLNEQTVPFAADIDYTFWNVLPTAILRYRISRTDNFNVVYRTNTQLPSIDQLQNVLDNSNPILLEIGNPNLVQAFQHRLFARYSKTNSDKGSVLFALLSGSYTANHIANSTYLDARDFDLDTDVELAEGAQLTRPVNLDGYWNVRGLLTYGFPVTALQSNLNVDINANYNRVPGLINEQLNFARTTTTGLGLTLGSNFSDRLDFTLSSRSTYNFVENSLQTATGNNFFNQSTRLRFNWLFESGFIFRTEAVHQLYDGLSDDFDQNFLLLNASIGLKLFAEQRGEISLSVFDLLKQNNSLSRTVTETFIEDQQTNVLQQYFMLSFKYDLRRFRQQR